LRTFFNTNSLFAWLIFKNLMEEDPGIDVTVRGKRSAILACNDKISQNPMESMGFAAIWNQSPRFTHGDMQYSAG